MKFFLSLFLLIFITFAGCGQNEKILQQITIMKTDEQWKQELTPEEYRVLREKGTEPAFSGEYYKHKEKGVYVCAGCGEELFSSDKKYDSGCGWPSFYAPDNNEGIKTETDKNFGMNRTEIMCSKCGGHLGHVFDDGPQPTGLRYCVNSASLNFQKSGKSQHVIRYTALGDSYTICEGLDEQERWPNLLVKHLNENGINIELVANPSVTGWTTKDLIDKELPIFKQAHPGFATLLIGVNDWVQKISEVIFRQNFRFILDQMLEELGSPNGIVVITIPDFSVTPQGPKYSGGRDITAGLAGFNAIIKQESEKKGIAVIDIFEVSQEMKTNPDMVAGDGLHPSAREYEIWEKMIFPVVFQMLKN